MTTKNNMAGAFTTGTARRRRAGEGSAEVTAQLQRVQTNVVINKATKIELQQKLLSEGHTMTQVIEALMERYLRDQKLQDQIRQDLGI